MLGTINSTNNNNGNRNTSWQLTRASIDGLAQAIEAGHNEALASYLGVMARFPQYSARNVLLIAAQCPHATRLEGLRSWNELGRFVRPGEKGIFIFAPAVGIQKQPQPQPQENGNGKKGKGKKAPDVNDQPPAEPQRQLLGFRGVYVFDIGQTGGEELRESRTPVDVAETLDKLKEFAKSQSMTIEAVDWIYPNQAVSYRGTIRVLSTLKANEALPPLLREVVSQMLYGTPRRTFVNRNLHKQETRAVAFVVCEALGLEAKAMFADNQLYFGDSRLLGESLEVVHRTAAQILGAISPEVPAQFAQEVQ